ncbi:hypothetical protein BBJ28_00020923 [Nothophytophthora sp. Chile5]|nr:hypothetical protein BBJ28_00020923 [Nothophytophthora sp. Chile5]
MESPSSAEANAVRFVFRSVVIREFSRLEDRLSICYVASLTWRFCIAFQSLPHAHEDATSSLQTAKVAASRHPASLSLPELPSAIFPAFAPDPSHQIRRAERVNWSNSPPSSPPSSPTGTRELFASIGKGDAFFELLASRGLTIGSTSDSSDVEDLQASNGHIDISHCLDSNGRTLLHQACRCGNVHATKCLLFHGASASVRCPEGRTPFHETTSSTLSNSTLELLKLLFEYEPAGFTLVDGNGSHVLHLAAIHGNLEVLKWCASLRTGPAKQPSSETSASTLRPYLLPLGITSFSGRSMLHYAAYNGRLNVLQWLLGPDNPRRGELELGALDVNGYSVLHYAAMGAPLEVCEWLVLNAPTRGQLSLTTRNSEGKTAVELADARPTAIKQFLAEASRLPSVPSDLRCIGADASSLGVAWHLEPACTDTRLDDTLKPLYFHLEVCKKPTGLSRASGFLTMLMLMPPTSPTSPRSPNPTPAAAFSSSYLLNWEPLGLLLQPEAREHWLCGLERDTEYLVRMRARNRNGFSGYSVPNLTGVFSTSGGRRRSASSLQRFFGISDQEPPPESFADSFIGNLHFELLEARGLPVASTSSLERGSEASAKTPKASQGRYYGVISIDTPSVSEGEASEGFGGNRRIYCVRTPLARLQQDVVLSGSSQAWRHPRFALKTVFRVPEAVAQTQVTIAVHHETQQRSNSCCVGQLSLSLADLIRGMPAKMQWLSLANASDSQADGGLILLRTLFLADGISELPHPTLPNTWGTTAEELLATEQPQEPPRSVGSGGSGSPPISSSSCRSLQASALVDRLGFRVFNPEMQLRNGEWQQSRVSEGAAKSYAYYQLLLEALEQQQELQWQRLRCQTHVDSTEGAPACRITHSEALESCAFDAFDRRAVRELVWRGIPASRRPELYSKMSGAQFLRSRFPLDYYGNLVQQLENPAEDDAQATTSGSRFAAAKRQIQVDLRRTFAGSEECWLTSHAGQKALERVLLAYALHNDVLGYCQSMTFVVGRLLCLFQAQSRLSKSDEGYEDQETLELPLEAEERVFWLLLVLCEDLFPSYYTQGMTGLQVDGAVLETLVRRRLPKVYRHFQKLQAPPVGLVLVTQWLLPLCCAVFPSETTFRFLDVLLFEGSTVVFAIAIALLRISQHELLAENADYTQLFRFLRARDQRLYDAPLLLEVAYEEHKLLGAEIEPLRRRFAQELEAERGEDTEKSRRNRKSSAWPTGASRARASVVTS